MTFTTGFQGYTAPGPREMRAEDITRSTSPSVAAITMLRCKIKAERDAEARAAWQAATRRKFPK